MPLARYLIEFGVMIGVVSAIVILIRAPGAPLIVWIVAPIFCAVIGIIASVVIAIIIASAMALAA